jgi:hypothetical protein
MKAAGRALSRADNSFVPIPLSKEQHIPKPEKNGQANGDQGISRRKVPFLRLVLSSLPGFDAFALNQFAASFVPISPLNPSAASTVRASGARASCSTNGNRFQICEYAVGRRKKLVMLVRISGLV